MGTFSKRNNTVTSGAALVDLLEMFSHILEVEEVLVHGRICKKKKPQIGQQELVPEVTALFLLEKMHTVKPLFLSTHLTPGTQLQVQYVNFQT